MLALAPLGLLPAGPRACGMARCGASAQMSLKLELNPEEAARLLEDGPAASQGPFGKGGALEGVANTLDSVAEVTLGALHAFDDKEVQDSSKNLQVRATTELGSASRVRESLCDSWDASPSSRGERRFAFEESEAEARRFTFDGDDNRVPSMGWRHLFHGGGESRLAFEEGVVSLRMHRAVVACRSSQLTCAALLVQRCCGRALCSQGWASWTTQSRTSCCPSRHVGLSMLGCSTSPPTSSSGLPRGLYS